MNKLNTQSQNVIFFPTKYDILSIKYNIIITKIIKTSKKNCVWTCPMIQNHKRNLKKKKTQKLKNNEIKRKLKNDFQKINPIFYFD